MSGHLATSARPHLPSSSCGTCPNKGARAQWQVWEGTAAWCPSKHRQCLESHRCPFESHILLSDPEQGAEPLGWERPVNSGWQSLVLGRTRRKHTYTYVHTGSGKARQHTRGFSTREGSDCLGSNPHSSPFQLAQDPCAHSLYWEVGWQYLGPSRSK